MVYLWVAESIMLSKIIITFLLHVSDKVWLLMYCKLTTLDSIWSLICYYSLYNHKFLNLAENLQSVLFELETFLLQKSQLFYTIIKVSESFLDLCCYKLSRLMIFHCLICGCCSWGTNDSNQKVIFNSVIFI